MKSPMFSLVQVKYVQNMEIEESDSNEINDEHIRKLFPNLEIPTLISFSYQEKITRPHLE